MKTPTIWFCASLVAVAAVLPTQAAPIASEEPAAAAEESAPAHGGGGLALLLLDYRLTLERLTEELRARTAELADGAQMMPGEMTGAWERVTAGHPLVLAGGLLAVLGAGLVGRRSIIRRLDTGNGARENGPARLGPRLGRAFHRALVDLLGLAAFALITLVLVAAFVPAPGSVRTFLLTYVTATLIVLAAALLTRFVLAPDAPEARVLPIGDTAAGFLHRWLVTLAAAGSVGWLSAALLILSGMRLQAHLLLALAIGTLIALLLVVMILQARPLVAAGGWWAMFPRHPARAWRAPGTSLRSSTWSWSGCSGQPAS